MNYVFEIFFFKNNRMYLIYLTIVYVNNYFV
jgi:hypothetical protein